jgi:hypothetical protein
MAVRQVEINNIKGRIAEALVESIFRRAEYKMTRFGRSHPQELTSEVVQ